MSVQNFWQVGKRGDYQIAQGASFCQHTERKDAEGKESMWQVKALPLTWTCNAGFWTVLVLCSLFALALYPGVGFLSPHQPFNLLFLVIICAGVRKSFTTWSCWWRRGGEAGLYTDSPSSYPTPPHPEHEDEVRQAKTKDEFSRSTTNGLALKSFNCAHKGYKGKAAQFTE